MPLTISDEQLSEAGITEQEARVEVACRLYDAGRLSLLHAMRWSNLSRVQFEAALIERGLPVVKMTLKDFEDDLATIQRIWG